MQLLAFRDQLRKQADFLRLLLISRWQYFVGLVGTGRDRIPCLELLCVDRVPVEEEVSDWAVIFGEVADEGRQLRMSQAIVAELESLDVLGGGQAQERGSQRVPV